MLGGRCLSTVILDIDSFLPMQSDLTGFINELVVAASCMRTAY
jgi:hypothetical protein